MIIRQGGVPCITAGIFIWHGDKTRLSSFSIQPFSLALVLIRVTRDLAPADPGQGVTKVAVKSVFFAWWDTDLTVTRIAVKGNTVLSSDGSQGRKIQ